MDKLVTFGLLAGFVGTVLMPVLWYRLGRNAGFSAGYRRAWDQAKEVYNRKLEGAGSRFRIE